MKFFSLLLMTAMMFESAFALADQDCAEDLSKTCAIVQESVDRSLAGKLILSNIRFANSDIWFYVSANSQIYTYSTAVIDDKTGEVTLKHKTSNDVISLGTVNLKGRTSSYVKVSLNPDLKIKDEKRLSEGWSNCVGTAYGIRHKLYTKTEEHFLQILSPSAKAPAVFYGHKDVVTKERICVL